MAEPPTRRYVRRLQPHPCAQCGAETQRPRFCSDACKCRFSDEGRLKADRNRSGPVCTCSVCFRPFQRPSDKGRDAGLCCSRECGFALIRWRGERSRLHQQAKAEFSRWARRSRARAERIPKPAPPAKSCLSCGDTVAKGKQRCDPCRAVRAEISKTRARESGSYKAAHRAAKARRRAVERGMDAERFDPFEIFERDGWRCHMCRAKTPKRLRGTYDDRAPELDHIIPLAAGGKHTRLNTACSCRKCNGAKGAKPMGQLRLAA